MVRAATVLAVLGGLVLATVPATAAEARTTVQVQRQESLSLSWAKCTPLPRQEQRCTEVELHASAGPGLEHLDRLGGGHPLGIGGEVGDDRHHVGSGGLDDDRLRGLVGHGEQASRSTGPRRPPITRSATRR